MYHPMTEPVRGTPDFISDGTQWAFAPSGHRHPFDRIIWILLLKHITDERKIVARWANQGEYTLRYDSDLADQVQSWDLGTRHRVKMWGDRIEQVLPNYSRKEQ